MTSGIYAIVNKINGKKYIGSAVDIKARWRVHICNLKKNKHHSSHLQNAWNKHGSESFEFIILITCSRQELLDCEQKHFDIYKPEYNIYPTAYSPLGHIVSEETKQKISQAKTGCFGPNTGKKFSEETRLKISLAKKGCKNPHKGNKKTEEEKRKISASLIGNKRACKKVTNNA